MRGIDSWECKHVNYFFYGTILYIIIFVIPIEDNFVKQFESVTVKDSWEQVDL